MPIWTSRPIFKRFLAPQFVLSTENQMRMRFVCRGTLLRKYRPLFSLLLGCGLLFMVGCEEKQVAPPPAPPVVEVVSVQQKDVPIYTEWITTLDGYVNAQIQPRVSGYLLKQNYTEGTVVRKGDVLFEIDARPFEAALQQPRQWR